MSNTETPTRRQDPSGLHPGPRPQVLLLVAAALAGVLFVVLFGTPGTFADQHVGESSYGAFQTTMWNYWFVSEHLLDPQALLHTDLQYHPFGVNVYLRIGNLLDIVVYQPFRWLLSEVLARNAFVWFVFWLNGMAMCWVARRFSGSDGVGLAAGLLFCLSRFLLEELFWGRLTNLFVFTLPLFLLAWHVAVYRGGARRVLVAAGLLALSGLFYIYYGVFLVLVVLLLVPFHLAGPGPRVPVRRLLVSLGLLFSITAVLVAPVAWPFLDPSVHEAVSSYELFGFDQLVSPNDAVTPDLAWYWTVVMPHSLSAMEVLRRLGPVPLIGLVVLVARRRSTWRRALPWLAVAGVAAVLSLGPYLVPAEAARGAWVDGVADNPPWRLPAFWLHAWVPFFSRFGHPERFSLVANLAVLLAASAAAGQLLPALGRRVQLITSALLVGLALADGLLLDRVAVLHTEPLHHSRFFRHLVREDDPGALVSLPIQASDFVCDHQRTHGWPMLNGYGSMFRIEVSDREAWLDFTENNTVWKYLEQAPLRASDPAWPEPEDWAFFVEHDVRYATLHRRAFETIHILEDGRIDEERIRPPEEFEVARSRLEHLLGRPIYEDGLVMVWDLGRRSRRPPPPPVVEPTPGHAGGGPPMPPPDAVRIAALSSFADGDAQAALTRCLEGRHELEPLPAQPSDVAPEGAHYVDLGHQAKQRLFQRYGDVLRDWGEDPCLLIDTPRGPMVLRRLSGASGAHGPASGEERP